MRSYIADLSARGLFDPSRLCDCNSFPGVGTLRAMLPHKALERATTVIVDGRALRHSERGSSSESWKV